MMKEKNVPANLEECVKPDLIPKRWWQMGSVVEMIGSIIMLLMELVCLVGIIVVGVILTNNGILSGFACVLYVIGALFVCGFAAFIFFIIYKIIALVFYTKSTVVYNSDVLTKIAIKNNAENKDAQ